MQPASLIRIFAAGLLTSIAACGGVVQEPEVTLENVQLGGLGLRGGRLLVTVQVANPNPFALGTDEVHYRLSIAEVAAPGDTAWLDLANGVYAERLSVGPGQTIRVQVPVEFSYAGLGGAAASVLREGSIAYQATGVVDVSTPLGNRRVPFQRDGVVDVLGSS